MNEAEDSDFRCQEFLRVKIGEAKDLLPKSSGCKERDVYCTVNLDREEIFRTCVAEKTLRPFFAEEFHFDIPRRFGKLAFYLYEKDRFDRKALGKVAIERGEIHKYNGKEHWIPIQPVNEDSEVEGKLHISVRTEHVISSKTGLSIEKLAVRVIECSQLAVVNGSCHPFILVALVNGKEKQNELKRTKTKKKTDSPLFDETFHFQMPHKEAESKWSINLSVHHDNGFSSSFLGQVSIPLDEIDLTRGYKCWHMLQPRSNKQEECKTLGSLRLKIQYTSDYVLSSRYYDPLRKLILASADVKPISSSAAFIFSELVANKLDAAQPLVKLFLESNQVIPLVKGLAEWEIAKVVDPTTIFRGNTLLSKFLDELMKLIGMKYLHETLRSPIHTIINEKKCCEIDTCKLKNRSDLNSNFENLKYYLNLVLSSITRSVIMCPKLMRDVFTALREISTKYYPGQREICYSVISGFIFLRFFAPAILNPRLFEITDQQCDPVVIRTLTLISKTVQMMGNLVSSKFGLAMQTHSTVFKEDYMSSLQKYFVTETHIENTRTFLELISYPNTVGQIIERPMVLKEGYLCKKIAGRRSRFRIRFRKFKNRFFRLTTQELLYSRCKHHSSNCWSIPISNILAVEKLREDSFQMKYMFQLISNGQTLYMKANNCVEEKEWLDILKKVCLSNQMRLHDYHPSAFTGTKYLCCQANSESSPGCLPISKSVPPDIVIHIDSDREVARIHSLLIDQIDLINDLLNSSSSNKFTRTLKSTVSDSSASTSTSTNDTQTIKSHSTSFSRGSNLVVIEEVSSFMNTLQNMHQVMQVLDHNQKVFLQKECNQTVYGSEKAPIGDINYLSLIERHRSSSENKSGESKNSSSADSNF